MEFGLKKLFVQLIYLISRVFFTWTFFLISCPLCAGLSSITPYLIILTFPVRQTASTSMASVASADSAFNPSNPLAGVYSPKTSHLSIVQPMLDQYHQQPQSESKSQKKCIFSNFQLFFRAKMDFDHFQNCKKCVLYF